MKLYINPEKNIWQEILRRPAAEQKAIKNSVENIMQDVKENGDEAVHRYTRKFDSPEAEILHVQESMLTEASRNVSTELKQAIDKAQQNIAAFHQAQMPEEISVETGKGLTCRQKPVPLSAVGLYVPGGTAPLFSTVLMLAVPAQIAGCSEIVLCTPPRQDGTIHPATLYAAHKAGVRRIVKAGGAQAVAAMTYSTESIPAVHKIFGPGNQYVTMAKQLAALEGLAIDMPAGPSEVLVVADASVPPHFAAIDLLSQAEHGPDSQVVLVTPDRVTAESIIKETSRLLEKLPRKNFASHSLTNSPVIVLDDRSRIMELVNAYAPEHLILETEDPENLAEQVEHAGSVFIGPYTPESLGDYASGTNHVLPTAGYARAFGGVNLDSFFKKITFQQATAEGLQNIGPYVMTMAEAEALEAHKLAVDIRLKSV